MPTILAAPLMFLVMYYQVWQASVECRDQQHAHSLEAYPHTHTHIHTQLAHPLAPFWQYYLLFVVVYGCASGIAYAISVLCPNSIAQLVGVLVVLVCMVTYLVCSLHVA